MTPIEKQQERHYKTIKKTCLAANIAYLFLRVFYLVLFIIAKLYILVWVDAATIVVYLLCFLLIKNKKYYLYALICGNEFFAFIITTTLMIGFNTGFHFYLIGLCVVSFFTSYFSKHKRTRGSLVWVGLSVIIYLTIYFISNNVPTYYQIDHWLEMTLFTTHAIVVFAFIAFYLIIFVKYALSLEKRITNESRTDELTQLNNRYGLYDFFAKEKDKTSKVLALLDIDNFKKINDEYGHVTGDYILENVSATIKSTLGDSFLCRYGGEEFVIVLDKEGFFDRLETLRKAIEQRVIKYEDVEHHITVTIGAADFKEGYSIEKWVNLADEKMYSGKKSGKNRTVK